MDRFYIKILSNLDIKFDIITSIEKIVLEFDMIDESYKYIKITLIKEDIIIITYLLSYLELQFSIQEETSI